MRPRRVNVGIIGAGLMGKEVAATLSRWSSLVDHPVEPRLTVVCDVDRRKLDWFDRLESVNTKVTDYRYLLSDGSVEVVYIAVRHDLHEQLCVDAIEAGKDVLLEKPFGIDLAAARRIVSATQAHAERFVRCSSEMPFFPGAQAAFEIVRSGDLGRIIEAESRLSHSSDIDLSKPLNWKRQAVYCGDAGVMNDLGMHVVHVPFRLGWMPRSVYAVLQNLVEWRTGTDGARAACDTWENATLVCDVDVADMPFMLTLSTKRIDPGQKNTWSFVAKGMDGAVGFSTRYPKTLRVMKIDRGEQAWQEVEMGSQSTFATVTGAIFETGFSDAMLQMWASFLAEREGDLGDRFGCVTPEEALRSHELWTAAMRSFERHTAVRVGES